MSFNMSSDDEFYDAEESTPGRVRSESSASASSGQLMVQAVPSLEEEERRLLELKQLAEERRRKEDEELQKKLRELEERKKQEKERLEAEQRAHEGEMRRRRLEEMRRKLAEDQTPPSKPPQKPPRLYLAKDEQGTETETSEKNSLKDEDTSGDSKANDITPSSTSVDVVSMETSQVNKESVNPADEKSAVEVVTSSEIAVIEEDERSQRSEVASLVEDSVSVDTESTGQTVIDIRSPTADEKTLQAGDADKPCVNKQTVVSNSTPNNFQDEIEISFKYDNKTESVIAEVTENVTNSEIEYITDSSFSVNVTKSDRTSAHSNSGVRNAGQGDSLRNAQMTDGHSYVTSVSTKPENVQMTKANSDASIDSKSQNSVVVSQSPAGPPVAPPRRKKKGKAPPPPPASVTNSPVPSEHSQHSPSPEKEDSNRESSPEQTSIDSKRGTPVPGSLDIVSCMEDDVEPIGLPTCESEMLSPVSTVFDLTKDLEKSLDLESATSGDRHVTASEDEEMKIGSSGKSTPMSSKNGTPEHTLQRPRSNSGRLLTDEEILEAVSVVNLDTGEAVPLNQAEDKLPKCVNPLSLHIMRRTQEYSSGSNLHDNKSDDDEADSHTKKQDEDTQTVCEVKIPRRHKKKGIKIKRFFGKTMNKIKSVADEVLHGEDSSSDSDDSAEGRRMIKIKASSAHKGPYDFDLLVPVQDLSGAHAGAVWTMKFSHCGRLLATGGQDNIVRIWVLKEAFSYFDDMRQKYSEAARVSPSPSQESINSMNEITDTTSDHGECDDTEVIGGEDEEDEHAPFRRRPFCVYRSHTADILDLSWSKNYFILSSSMDKTVRLWHVSRKECLCCFQHIDFVTAIAFHPRDDRYFLSGSLDGKLRLWNIPDKKVAMWNEVTGTSKLITAANFCMNGRFAVVGTYDGRCIFYSTEQLKYYTQIHVRSTRGKNARGRKISGIEPMPGQDKVLVTSNDSRVRLYDLRDLTLTCKYKGYVNNSSQIKASFNHNGKYIVSGSEDHFVYIWHTQHEFHKLSSARRDRNDFWEGIKAHGAVVTSAIFTPNPSLLIKPQFEFMDSQQKEMPAVRGEVFISADFQGCIKVFLNKFKPGSGYM